jgi:hypothetical protein
MGIARTPDPETSLAAWPVALGLVKVLSSPTWPFSETVVTLERDQRSRKRLRSFILITGLVLSSILALIAFTPLGSFYFNELIGVEYEIETLSKTGVQWLLLIPLIMASRNLLRGRHIKQKTTRSIQSAMVVYVLISLGIMGAGVYLFQIKGIILASFAMVFSHLLEVGVLIRTDKTQHEDHGSK